MAQNAPLKPDEGPLSHDEAVRSEMPAGVHTGFASFASIVRPDRAQVDLEAQVHELRLRLNIASVREDLQEVARLEKEIESLDSDVPAGSRHISWSAQNLIAEALSFIDETRAESKKNFDAALLATVRSGRAGTSAANAMIPDSEWGLALRSVLDSCPVKIWPGFDVVKCIDGQLNCLVLLGDDPDAIGQAIHAAPADKKEAMITVMGYLSVLRNGLWGQRQSSGNVHFDRAVISASLIAYTGVKDDAFAVGLKKIRRHIRGGSSGKDGILQKALTRLGTPGRVVQMTCVVLEASLRRLGAFLKPQVAAEALHLITPSVKMRMGNLRLTTTSTEEVGRGKDKKTVEKRFIVPMSIKREKIDERLNVSEQRMLAAFNSVTVGIIDVLTNDREVHNAHDSLIGLFTSEELLRRRMTQIYLARTAFTSVAQKRSDRCRRTLHKRMKEAGKPASKDNKIDDAEWTTEMSALIDSDSMAEIDYNRLRQLLGDIDFNEIEAVPDATMKRNLVKWLTVEEVSGIYPLDDSESDEA